MTEKGGKRNRCKGRKEESERVWKEQSEKGGRRRESEKKEEEKCGWKQAGIIFKMIKNVKEKKMQKENKSLTEKCTTIQKYDRKGEERKRREKKERESK